ncbi:MAG: hypothetical protein KBC22_02555 [Candidatus Pacebacteria bacterium]|nr:hypothetical protein [Candidatus Paceibacterota bacterium]
MNVQTLPPFEKVSRFNPTQMRGFLDDLLMGAQADNNTDLAEKLAFLREIELSQTDLAAMALVLCGDYSKDVCDNLAGTTNLESMLTSWQAEYEQGDMVPDLQKKYAALAKWKALGFRTIPLTISVQAITLEMRFRQTLDLG